MSADLQQNYEGVWDTRIGFGQKPALVVIDFMKGYTDPESPLFAPDVVKAVSASAPLIEQARSQGIPVIHTNILYHSGFMDGGVWLKKAPVMKAMVKGNPYAEFCDAVAPLESELIFTKQYASAFFGTSLSSTLTALGVDTVVLLGCSTSGCIRASAVDAMQYGFRPIVVRECVGDRHSAPHEANLFDIDSKYGDVVLREEVMEYLSHLNA
ncbi:N-carbamoylsarcosine amidohydrolase [Neptunomonas phycophila]|uniref:N-carbamoylsarcosine amidohydrolase n=1 Tax=Neptunomonas TaxID=75687 RepID=UPI001BE67606|nr:MULTISPECIES: N-carbamoylsarcosine amidohydrolase [Neptunomonas]MBT3145737.1 isochorismatase family protein [Neptunomonas phycophila]MDN2660234.1 N-carbamoylsarcosine amidohydrolase [Neptunomonas sp. CHC150]MDO6784304.1 N-carbamoylsarcosine amidohydrolase [Neptunomonas phycophila]